MNLPSAITEKAFHTQNDEYAWQKKDVSLAIDALVNDSLAILGGEVWVIDGGRIIAAPPMKTGGTNIIVWDTKKKSDEETWKAFVKRTAQETITKIYDMNIEEEVKMGVADKVYYNLAYADEEEYKQLGSADV